MLNRLHHLIARQCLWWCVAGVLLVVLQPFLCADSGHGRMDDEGELNVRSADASWAIEADDRGGSGSGLETTLFVPATAGIDTPHALKHGIDCLLALIFLLVPLTVASRRSAEAYDDVAPPPVPPRSGAPPPTACRWHRLPPKTAPPLTC